MVHFTLLITPLISKFKTLQVPIESYGDSIFFGSSGQFLGTNETRNDIYHRREVLRDLMYIFMLLFSLCIGVFEFRLLFISFFFAHPILRLKN